MRKTTQFRRMIEGDTIVMMPGAYDGMSARLVEETGFKAMLATGAGISNSLLGMADVGLTTMTEVSQTVARMSEVTNIPILVDADTGYGNAINVIRTVREMERAGAAAIQFEDQVAPKKCGHFHGKNVVSKNEMIYKIKAAVDTRVDDDLIILARTDSRAVHGLEDAMERAFDYFEAGADITFIEAPQSLEELKTITKQLKGIPQMANMVEGGLTPILSVEELQDIGFKLMVCANTALRGAMLGIRNALDVLFRERSQKNLQSYIYSWEERQALVKLNEFQKLEEKYLNLVD